jgi:CRISPR-associated protein Csm5
MKTYKLKLTALSPIHIGTGEDYEPINYVIDKLKFKASDGKIVEKDYMFVFDEMEFFSNLDNAKKQEFNKIVSDTSYDARFKLYGFVVSNKDIAKRIAVQKISVFSTVADDYRKGIGKVVNKEADGKKVFNKFNIAKTYISPNTQKPIILGSSLKGSISTAYQEELLRQTRDYDKVQDLMLKPTAQNLFKNFSISDANPIKQATFIDEAINKKRNKEAKRDDSGVKIRLQAIVQTSEFETQITIKEKLDFDSILKSCNDHYLPLFKSQFDYQTDEFTRQALSDSFIAKYEKWEPKHNQFLLKVGKYSGARAVTVDGVRNIKIMQGKNKPPRYDNEETTFWYINNLPFGWLLCEIIE